MYTFKVSNVPASTYVPELLSPRDAVTRLLPEGGHIEGAGARSDALIGTQVHGFIDAVGLGFAEHMPLVLSPVTSG